MTRAEEATQRIHNRAILEAKKYSNSHGGSITEEVAYGRGFKAGFIEGYEVAEKDVKDALLEWAKEHQEGERQGSYTWSCYQIFIDKLNSM